MNLILPVSKGPFSVESAVSCLYRVFEEFPINSGQIIYDLASEEAGIVAEVAKDLLRGGVETVNIRGGEEPGTAYEIIRKCIEPYVDEGIIAVVSPASRRGAASLAMACIARLSGRKMDITHVHFHWGEWGGLAYPYTPRRLEPVVSMYAGGREFSQEIRNAAEHTVNLEDNESPRWGMKLPPLRRCIAELARRINVKNNSPYRKPSTTTPEAKILVEAKIADKEAVAEANLYNINDIASLLSKISEKILKVNNEHLHEILAWSGCAELKGTKYKPLEAIDLREPYKSREIIIDTNMLYFGIHNAAYMGSLITVPECVMYEVEKRVYEAVKRGRPDNWAKFMDCLAYLGLKEIFNVRTSIYPSQGLSCDSAIPKIDPVLLRGKKVMTGDDGAFRMWSRSPVAELASVYKAIYDKQSAALLHKRADSIRISRLYYSFIQLLVALRLSESAGLMDKISLYVDGKRTDIPVEPIKEELVL
ncbi:MAG TPA: hypothetical protein EYH45_03415 [Candidatus Caldiarchaeum subterraneum]|uniref:PIN domain-containing protein n=1 Tax=Caldiarchaeum subterraneum TaxID=311458 RepID=A0A832ZVS3_CALS0|nr:hypothetical protein [Candidatus Caldarchaeum subterraneum]